MIGGSDGNAKCIAYTSYMASCGSSGECGNVGLTDGSVPPRRAFPSGRATQPRATRSGSVGWTPGAGDGIDHRQRIRRRTRHGAARLAARELPHDARGQEGRRHRRHEPVRVRREHRQLRRQRSSRWLKHGIQRGHGRSVEPGHGVGRQGAPPCIRAHWQRSTPGAGRRE